MTQRCDSIDQVAPGERGLVRVPITVTLAGTEIALWVHVVRGVEAGPTLLLLGTQHGDEWLGAEVLRKVVTEVDAGALRGTLLAVPVSNPPALELGQRTVPDEAGGTDLNRAYPGRSPLITDRLASVITEQLLSRSHALLDYHFGDWAVTWATVGFPNDLPDETVRRQAEELAIAFGFPCVHRARIVSGRVGGGSASGYAGLTLKIPSLAVSIGGPGFGPAVEAVWIDQGVAGTKRVMQHLGMLAGTPPPMAPSVLFETSWYVRPSVGGILKSCVPPERLLTQVTEGEPLGEVISPYTFERLEVLVAPRAGILISIAGDHPVHPGNWGFAAADLTDPMTIVENAALG